MSAAILPFGPPRNLDGRQLSRWRREQAEVLKPSKPFAEHFFCVHAIVESRLPYLYRALNERWWITHTIGKDQIRKRKGFTNECVQICRRTEIIFSYDSSPIRGSLGIS